MLRLGVAPSRTGGMFEVSKVTRRLLTCHRRKEAAVAVATAWQQRQHRGLVLVPQQRSIWVDAQTRKEAATKTNSCNSHGALRTSTVGKGGASITTAVPYAADQPPSPTKSMLQRAQLPVADENSIAGSTKRLTIPDFTDPQSAHGTKKVTDLLRAIFVLNTCRVGFIVAHAKTLLYLSHRILGQGLSNAALKLTFYKHFTAGENADVIRPFIENLRRHGIESILDYVAESDDRSSDNDNESGTPDDVYVAPQHPNQPARIYRYTSERQCDRHRDTFLSCIRAVRDVSPERGFAALKVTALGNPLLLERMSKAIVEARRLFEKFDTDGDGIVTHREFETGYRSNFVDADTRLPELLAQLDPENTGGIDYITWSKLLSPADLPGLVSSCREVGPLALAVPSREELSLLGAMNARAHDLAQEAALHGTRLLFDAEQTYYQPAIDNLVLELQQKYNAKDVADFPIIFNTYQCYLKDMPRRMILDLERSQRFSYHFGAKLVRGAYMDRERKLAKKLHHPSPIHDTIDDTHECYDEAVEYLLRHRAENGTGLEVMCATHNQTSIERAITLMDTLGIRADDHTVHFAQLLGMADNLTFTLGKDGFQAYKYVPYGEVNEAIPYLLRRAEENRSLLKHSKQELKLLYGELRRRAFG